MNPQIRFWRLGLSFALALLVVLPGSLLAQLKIHQ
jgi:uncharacterized membrane protein